MKCARGWSATLPATSAITPCTLFLLVQGARVQAKGGAKRGPNVQGTYASKVRLKPAGPEKKRPNSERFPDIPVWIKSIVTHDSNRISRTRQ